MNTSVGGDDVEQVLRLCFVVQIRLRVDVPCLSVDAEHEPAFLDGVLREAVHHVTVESRVLVGRPDTKHSTTDSDVLLQAQL